MVLMLLVLAPSARAEGPGARSVELESGWRYRWGDSPVGPDGVPTWAHEADAEDWRPMVALREPPGKGSNTFLWLSLPVPHGTWPEPALFLGTVANAFEVYAGGRRVYASGTLNPSGHESMENMAWNLVTLPPSVPGTRVLLRIQSTGQTIGASREARVGSRHELAARVTRDGLAPFVMGTLLLVVAAVSAGAALLRRQRRMLVALTVFAGGSGLMLLGSSGLLVSLWDAKLLSSQLTLLGAYLLLPGLGWFISDSILEGQLRWFRWGATVLSVPAALQSLMLFVDLGTVYRQLHLFTFYSLPCLFLCVIVAARAAWRGSIDARIFVVGLGVLTFVLLLSTLPLLGFTEVTGTYHHWGFMALTVSLVGIVARRSTMVVRSLASHTRQLEARSKDVRELATGMGRGAGELATVVQQLRTSSEEQTVGIGRQATALKELEQTVQEIRQGSLVTADKTRLLASSIVVAEEAGRDGGAAIDRTLSNLEAIRVEVSEMARRILALDARTREISGIVDTVKGLADQSNMLAVNAAIEAARSGEHGRGFAVVSREVRSLADQSILATQRIREVLEGVNTSMREAAKMSEQGEQRVKVSLDAVRVSGSQLQKLAGIIGDTSSSVRQISMAVSQQDAGTSQIAMAIQDLSGQMQQTLRVVEETQRVSRSVQTLAESMSGAAGKALQSGTLGA
ncbi:chemotaxis protein [Myxococcus sp. CA056]|uniref:methyl-accepting chemotaxis protein n=1 Tax=unclassified Myxococcus TaxID=2648731 RepID=UPI00157A2D1A|nr:MULTISPECIES: methyl-accepting chemotaxis protein [unclassified Myxococcus]NTX09664.1 chemotaxis protein [Myxococcus sp. CA056]NTX51495.1 chemotaxis protein [Myxococcus sp. CA039A]